MEEIQRVKTIFLKGKNKRIGIELNQSSEKGFFYLVHTKTLIDFSKRNISKTTSVFSVETFNVLFTSGFTEFINDDYIQNKILINEKTEQFTGSRSVNKDFKRIVVKNKALALLQITVCVYARYAKR